MSWLLSFMEWFVVLMTLVATLGSVLLFFRHTEFHTRETLFAIVALGILALASLFLTLAQARSIIRGGFDTYILFMALFFLLMSITQSRIFNRSLKGRGWHIYRIGLAVFAIVFALLAIVAYLYHL